MSAPERLGGYRPNQPIQSGPLFRWPPQPTSLLMWLFGFPGYLWPWNTLFLVLSFLSWRFLTPEMNEMKSLEAGWIALLLARNLGMLLLFVGTWHVRLYVLKAQGTSYKYNSRWHSIGNQTFLFGNQLWDNIFWSVVSAVPIWTAYEGLAYWQHANGFVPSVSWQAHTSYCFLLLLVTPLWLNVHFYVTHRLIHWPPLYRAIHRIHHKNVNPGAWSGLAMHPVEHLVYFSAVSLYWIVPSHPMHTLFSLQLLALGATLAHHGFDRLVLVRGRTLDTGHYMHYLHHKYVTVNFGTELVPLDKWLGTFHDGSDDAMEALKNRARVRMLRTRCKRDPAERGR